MGRKRIKPIKPISEAILNEQLLKQIARKYFNILRGKFNYFCDVNEELNHYETVVKVSTFKKSSLRKEELFIHRVNKAYKNLTKEERLVIVYEFFYNNYPFWYMRFYDEKTYRKVRKSAIENFIKYIKDYQLDISEL